MSASASIQWDLPVKPYKASAPTGSFNAMVKGETLYLPTKVFDALQACNAEPTTLYLLSFLSCFPSALATEMGWQLQDVEKARDGLKTTLKGHVPDSILNPPKREPRATGARNPDAEKPPTLN